MRASRTGISLSQPLEQAAVVTWVGHCAHEYNFSCHLDLQAAGLYAVNLVLCERMYGRPYLRKGSGVLPRERDWLLLER